MMEITTTTTTTQLLLSKEMREKHKDTLGYCMDHFIMLAFDRFDH